MYKIVNDINPEIFRGYDIRGITDKDLNVDVYYTLGRAYATFLTQRRIKQAAVGRDNRLPSEKFQNAFQAGLNDGGIDVFDIGLSLSQITYYSCYHFQIKGATMITASHNPAEYDGMKLSVGYSDTMVSKEIQELRQIAEKGEFSQGKGTITKVDIYLDYQKHILKHFSLTKKWKVVVEGCNSTPGLFYPKLFKAAGYEVIEQNCELDGTFPLGVPDPTEVKVLDRLAEGVKKHKADIGFAYDSDGDRMAVVDEKGQVLWMDTIVSLFAQDVLENIPGAEIVYNTLCSRQVPEVITKAGGKPVMWLTGHSFIKAKLKEIRAPFAGELSGHIFFMDNFYGHDDAAYASLRLLAFLERKNLTLSQAVAKLPQYISSPEVKFGLPSDDMKFDFVDNKVAKDFVKTWPDAKIFDIEGIRIETDEEMAIVRASQNGPYITLKFEAKTQAGYDKMKTSIREIFKQYKEIDWKKGVNTHALD
jgi:phosphomannomutase / phosphoglucomutase